MFCKNCGTQIGEETLFCPSCGKKTGYNQLNESAKQLQAGEPAAFELIYKGTYAEIKSIVWGMLYGNETEIADCLQEIYLKLYEKIHLFDPEKASLMTWLKQMARNETIDYIRKLKRKNTSESLFSTMEDGDSDMGEVEFESETIEFNPEAQMDRKETERLIGEILDDLPEAQRVCILMYYMQNMKQGEIAQTLGVPEGTVKSRLNKGKAFVETKVRELAKKGTKLYGMAPLPFLLWLLLQEKQTFLAGSMGAYAAAAGSATAQAAKRVAEAGAKEMPGGAAKAAARTAAGTGKAAFTKAVAGIVAAGVIGTGGYIGYNQYQKHKPVDENTSSKVLAETLGYDYTGDTFLAATEKIEIPTGCITACARDFDNDGENEILAVVMEQTDASCGQKVCFFEKEDSTWTRRAEIPGPQVVDGGFYCNVFLSDTDIVVVNTDERAGAAYNIPMLYAYTPAGIQQKEFEQIDIEKGYWKNEAVPLSWSSISEFKTEDNTEIAWDGTANESYIVDYIDGTELIEYKKFIFGGAYPRYFKEYVSLEKGDSVLGQLIEYTEQETNNLQLFHIIKTIEEDTNIMEYTLNGIG